MECFRLVCQRSSSLSSGGQSNTMVVSSRTLSVDETLTNQMNVRNMRIHTDLDVYLYLLLFLDILDWNYFYWYTSTELSHRF